MERRRPITEDDLLLTELLLVRSYGNLKDSVLRTSSRSIGSLGGTIRRHPYAAAGTAIGAGLILFLLFRLLGRSGGRNERESSARQDPAMEMLSLLMPVITPYLRAYVERYVGGMFARSRH